MKNMFTGLSKNTFLLTFTSLFADIATEMLYPVLPIFLTQTLLAPTSIVGIVEGVAIATQNIVQGFSGYLADKTQNRKFVALVGYGLAAVAKPFIGASVIWQEVLGARFLDRLGTGTRSAPRDALIAASADEAHRGKAFGLEGIGDNLGACIGPFLAVVLLFFIHVPIRWIFYLAFIPGFLALLMVLFVSEPKKVVSAKITIETKLQKFPVLYWKYIFVTAVFGIGNSSNAFLILRAKQIGIPLEITIVIYALFNLVAALISYPSGALSDKFGRKNILLFSFLIFITTYAGFAFGKNYYLIAFLFILYGLFGGIFRAVGKSLAVDFTPAHLKASGIGWYSTTIGISNLIASIVAGYLWTLVSPQTTFIYGIISAVIGAFLLIVLIPKSVTRPQ